MMNSLWCYTFVVFLTISFSAASSRNSEEFPKSYKRYKVIEVYINSNKDARALERIQKKYKNSVYRWTEHLWKDMFVLLHVSQASFKKVKAALTKKHLTYNIIQNDLNKLIKAERGSQRLDENAESVFSFAKHNNFKEIENFLQKITKKYDNISRLEVIGNTHEKRPLYAVNISKGKNRRNFKPVIMIECGIHAREWSSIEVCVYFINELLRQKKNKVKQITTMYDFVLLPVMNPDGFVYSMTKDTIRKPGKFQYKPFEGS
ncbi:mast cell carboxypeptidase A [Nephila pilipes]|uniref:Mast cell carboxypeptidase A n=1 Tax=Nephila pilipes TaxID=299642 RepID=A0A8X6QAX7_NEPPI|nr:mast cell carboxypeptidase A [Nephila pilipes]